MKTKDELIAKTGVSRRTFLRGVSAMGASASLYGLYGCGGGGGEESLLVPTAGSYLVPPTLETTIVAGAAPHNCGGRCVTKAYVSNGIIKRFVTDERPDKNPIDGTGDDPQRRACPRCRAYKGRLYRPDRLLYPLKQTKERGDLTGFVRISWDQANAEIAIKMEQVKSANAGKTYTKTDGTTGTTTGNEVFHNMYASGDGGAPGAAACSGRLLSLFGGAIPYRSDYSWPSIEHMSWFVLGQNLYFPSGNSQSDVVKAELVILWANNYSELIWGTNSMWYITQAREMGAEVIAVEGRQTDTVSTAADEWLPVLPGTDPALLLALMYVMIDEGLLDKAFIKKYVHGFFDNPEPSHYHADGANDPLSAKYIVPAGASLSAYVMGTDNRLVASGDNLATSVYPDNIYYNVNAEDVLSGKPNKCFGQTPKTPEWAEKITGVKASTIRALARKWASKRTTVLIGGGWQRQSEGEQVPWLIYVMGAITKNFGQSGSNIAMNNNKAPVSFNANPAAAANPVATAAAAYLYDTKKLTSLTYTPAITRGTFPVFLWSDAVDRGETGTSKWNDAQINRLAMPIKALFNFGGNIIVNQDGDANYKVSELIPKSKGKLDLIVVADQCMTASARVADYVLPAAMAWEKEAGTTTWVVGDNVIHMGKAIEPPGEAKPDYDICAGIAAKLGLDFTQGKTIGDLVKGGWNASPYAKSMSYDQWKEIGIYSTANENTPAFIQFKSFRDAPATSPLATPSGKFEAYSQALVEDYEARGYSNIDSRTTLLGPLHDGKTSGRFVYPVPMYIPILEGGHADGSHPDPSGAHANGYTLQLMASHLRYRSHSTHNNNAYLNEFYKGDGTKNASPYNDQSAGAFLDPGRAGHGNPNRFNSVWDDKVYEPVWINPADANKLGISDGNRVLISNDRGKVYAIAQVTNRAHPGVVCLGQGGWYNGTGDKSAIDVGGCANTLTKRRPSRICQGMTLGSDTLVRIELAQLG